MKNREHGSQAKGPGSGSENEELKKKETGSGSKNEELKKIVVDVDVDIPDDPQQKNEQQPNITRRWELC